MNAIKSRAKKIAAQMDTDGDGVVTWAEFVHFILLTLFGEQGRAPADDLTHLKTLKKPRNYMSEWHTIRNLR